MKKILSLTLALALILCLCSCGSVGRPDEPHKTEPSTPQQTAASPEITEGLDVTLYTGLTPSGTVVTEDTPLFTAVSVWEPGSFNYENLTVSNNGTLPLDFQLRLSFANATATESGETLADILKVAVIPGGVISADRHDILSSVTQWYDLESFTQSGSLTPGEASTFAIILYWDSGYDGNEYHGLSIELSVALTASEAPDSPTPPETTAKEPVVTVTEYTREIVKTPESNTYLTHHTVRYPMLTHPGADAQAINADIEDRCSSTIETLEAYEEGEYIYLVNYSYTNYNGLIGLVMRYDIGLHYGGLYGTAMEYFFDSNTGKRLTYEEYRQALGLTDAQIHAAVEADPQCQYLSTFTVRWLVADAEQTLVMIDSPDTLDGSCLQPLEVSILTP